ncbi:MAG TPA: HD domain-containing protein [Candidatus Paceibacterota bacterium]|nr:HD domain-containing protein [Candidatus Paceibacterota bacterium]
MSRKFSIPPEVSRITRKLEEAGFEAYLIGGCVRDLLLERKPKDWDVTTNATPEEIIQNFDKTFYENDYGTVGVVNEEAEDETLKVVEMTPYRLEATYSDNRHPDSVTFSQNLEDDLKRRDFTINAIALKIVATAKENYDGEVVDLYQGQKDIEKKIVRTVGDPNERFKEDGLRILRAIRLSAELGFKIAPETEEAIKNDAGLLKNIARERIREEFVRILMSAKPADALKTAKNLGVLKFIIPELEKASGIEQNQAHAYDVFEHLLKSLQAAADKGWSLEIRLAALLHDIAKPQSRRWSNEKKDWTFHGHDVVGARVAAKILNDLRFPNKLIEEVTKLIRWHMFFSDPDQITLSAVRRLLKNVGKENVWNLMNLRICDRIGTGRPKEDPYRLRKYKSMIEEVMHDPVSVGMLKIDGSKIMEVANLPSGPKIGYILHALLEEVLEDPSLNTKEHLYERAVDLSKLTEEQLKKIGEKGKERKERLQEEEVKEIRKKYWVQ